MKVLDGWWKGDNGGRSTNESRTVQKKNECLSVVMRTLMVLAFHDFCCCLTACQSVPLCLKSEEILEPGPVLEIEKVECADCILKSSMTSASNWERIDDSSGGGVIEHIEWTGLEETTSCATQ